jgi:secreted trypsin-like serine protease
MPRGNRLKPLSVSGTCKKCSSPKPFDAEVAYRRLTRKQMELASTVSEYMSQAGLNRDVRTANALMLAERIDRIVGGQPANAGEYPDCCLVGRQNANGTFRWFCTGVLIHSRVVLTAGHCLIPDHIANSVALKAEDQSDLTDAEVINIQKMIAHPLYVQSHQIHDVSVIILKEDSERAKPAPLATKEELEKAQKTTLVGFGNNDVASTRGFGIKRKVMVDITEMRRSSGGDLASLEHTLGFDATCEFIAGGKGYDSCNGDSGGPAYISLNGTMKVAGLTSRSVEEADEPCGEGGIYSRIDANLDFLKTTAADAGIAI